MAIPMEDLSPLQSLKFDFRDLAELLFWRGETLMKESFAGNIKETSWKNWFDFCEKVPPCKSLISFRDQLDELYSER